MVVRTPYYKNECVRTIRRESCSGLEGASTLSVLQSRGQTSQIPSALSKKRDCSSTKTKGLRTALPSCGQKQSNLRESGLGFGVRTAVKGKKKPTREEHAQVFPR